MSRLCISALVALWSIAWACSPGSTVHAQQVPEAIEPSSAPTAEDYQSSYRPISPRAVAPTPAQLKAQARGAQRMARLEALRWYGFSNSRPTATAMPWTTMYSPAWQMPGGRPFAWHVSQRPVTIYVSPREMYR